jgi:hypothetical protein
MSIYAGLSMREIYLKKCEDLGVRKNSQFVAFLPDKPDQFDFPQEISVAKNFLGPKGLRPLLEVVRVCTNLRSLDLRDQQLTKESIDELCTVLLNNKTLTRLNLADNPLTIASGAVIADLVKANQNIEYVVLENTQIRQAMCNAIDSQLERNRLNKQPRIVNPDDGSDSILALTSSKGAATVPSLKNMEQLVVRKAMQGLPFSVTSTLFDENVQPPLATLCKQCNAAFYDVQFEPNELSIQKTVSAQYFASEWKRIPEINPNASIYPSNNDIFMPKNSPIAFSWLFLTIQASVDPSFLRALITPQSISPYGVYTVKFFIDGTWRYVVIDDYLPVRADGSCCFTGPVDGNFFWPCLIEKAVAKLHGGFQALDQSVTIRHPGEKRVSCATAMCDFTGGVGISRDLHHEEFNSEDWWNTLLELHASKAKLVASSMKASFDESLLKGLGIVPNHAYEILHVRQINGFKLLHLKSDWADRIWCGEWSDKSKAWEQHPAIAEALGIRHKADNSFWIPYVKFLQCFAGVHLCRLFGASNNKILECEWTRGTAGGPYFDASWCYNPRYSLALNESGPVFINLCLPDSRFASSDVDTLAFHVVKSEHFPVRFDKDQLVAKTSYVITNSVSYDGAMEEGKYWIVPSSYTAGKLSRFFLRVFSTSAFIIRHEELRLHWNQRTISTKVENSGEYQNGEDNLQFLLEFPENEVDGQGKEGRVILKLHTPETEQLSLALFLVDSTGSATKGRVIGPIPEDSIIARSKFLISNTIYLEFFVPPRAGKYTVVTCVNPERSWADVEVTAWSSIQKFSFTEIPIWKKKQVVADWTSSGSYQDTTRNPVFELITTIPNTTFVIRVQVSGCNDPSIVFFVVNNKGRQGESIRGRIPDDRILCRSAYIRGDSVVKEFPTGAFPPDSYLIVPCLQPPGMKGQCVLSVSCYLDDFTLKVISRGE